MMRCPSCTNETKVTDSREKVNNDVRRRRVCHSCGYRFSTTERLNRSNGHNRLKAAGKQEVRELLARAIQIIDGEETCEGRENRPPEESGPDSCRKCASPGEHLTKREESRAISGL